MDNNVLDIIIVNFNSTDYLLKCVSSIYASPTKITPNIFVIDNNSTDDVRRIKESFPQIVLFQNKINIGFAAAINQGIRKSKAKYLLFLNPDTLLLNDFFQPILEYLENNKSTGIIGPKILDTDGTIQGSARAFPNALTALYGRSSPLTKYFPNNPISRANTMTIGRNMGNPMVVDWVSGACMMIRRQAIDEVGPLDERFFMYWEDADFCRRMWHKGWKVVYFPGPSLHHHIGKSSDSRPLKSIYHFHRSSFLLFEKYAKGTGRAVLPMAFFALVARGVMIGCWNIIRRKVITPRPLKKVIPSAVVKQAQSEVDNNLPKKIKILRVISRFNIGGPAIHVNQLQNGLNKNGFKSILITGSLSPLEGDMSYILATDPESIFTITEMQRELNLTKDLKALLSLFKIIRRFDPDIIHSHTAKAGTIARSAGIMYNLLFRKRIKMIHTFHGHVFEGYFSKLKSSFFIWTERILAAFTRKIIAISPTQREDFVKKYRIANDEKFETIKLGFDLTPFVNNAVLKGRFRKELGIDNDVWLVGIIGRLVPVKNHTMFLKAVVHFTHQYPDTKILFTIIGGGELRDDLEYFCIQQGISEHVRFCGWIKDIQYVYADLNTLVLTSINEGTPVSIIEAMASSVPVVSTDVGGIKDLLGGTTGSLASNGFKICERGLLLTKNDPQSLSNSIRYIIDNLDTIDRRIVSHAREFVVSDYNQDRLVHDIRSLYFKLLK
jgi:GT2 family glycosyltransferase/glycosyltransferase involved in cell wall biosynthesis